MFWFFFLFNLLFFRCIVGDIWCFVFVFGNICRLLFLYGVVNFFWDFCVWGIDFFICGLSDFYVEVVVCVLFVVFVRLNWVLFFNIIVFYYIFCCLNGMICLLLFWMWCSIDIILLWIVFEIYIFYFWGLLEYFLWICFCLLFVNGVSECIR